ncbi:hypothetical protein R3P38DRAFT_1343205 [Favolaschia claudopus]|uniref:Uncharacterized protein n=1 Tax=Favolaschia claudopus TaxID=2862362 RepID=A0AAW0DTA4_9AGAR
MHCHKSRAAVCIYHEPLDHMMHQQLHRFFRNLSQAHWRSCWRCEKTRSKCTFCAEINSPPGSPIEPAEVNHTAWNAFSLALTTLSGVSSQIPLATPLSAIIDSLLTLAGRIEQTSANAHGFADLASRIELLAPIVEDLAKNDRKKGRVIVRKLETEFRSLKKEFETARRKGKLVQFLNCDDNTETIEKHNTVLAQLIADATFANTTEVLLLLREPRVTRRLWSPYDTEQLIGQGPGIPSAHKLIDAAMGVRIPYLSVKDFCRSYGVSDTICKLLSDQGFETAGALWETDDRTLSDVGFKPGQIAELSRALKQFVANANKRRRHADTS